MSLLSNLHIQLFQDTFSLAYSDYAICFVFHSFIFSKQENTETKGPKLFTNSQCINIQFTETLLHTQKIHAHETARGKEAKGTPWAEQRGYPKEHIFK